MAPLLCLSVLLLLLLAAAHSGSAGNCHTSCNCEVESFGLFDSFSLTRVDCHGVVSDTMPVSIPLDTAYLDLSANAIGVLTDTMLTGPGYTTLVSLDLSGNSIDQVSPKALARLRYLETLDLSNNMLEKLPHGCFSGLPLAEVDLSHNRFREFDMDVFAHKVSGELVRVDLSHNRLTAVYQSHHTGMLHLQSLLLAGNQLMNVPKFSYVPLRDLNLDGNPIERIKEGAFAKLKDLVHLSLSELPELSVIEPNSFEGLQSLLVLDLSNNKKLKTLSPVVFSGLMSLHELNLSHSGVTSLPNHMLSHLPSIKSITLGQNVQCWRTLKQGQYHRQLGQVQHDEVLTCNLEGFVL